MPPADIEDQRMEVYRNSIYLNIERMVSNFFPVLKKVLAETQWRSMVRDYFVQHRSHVPPYLPKLGQEFVHYLEHERDLSRDPSFILELAYYEWSSFALSIDVREIEWDGIDTTENNLLIGVPVLNPLILTMNCRYPVHQIGPEYIPDKVPEQPTYIVVYRDRNYKIGFMELNPVSARLLELIQKNQDIPARQLLEGIATELQHPDVEVVIKGGQEIMQRLQAKDVILGARIGY